MKKKKLSSEVASKTQGPKLEKASAPDRGRLPEQAQYRARSGWGGMDVYAYGVRGLMEQAKTLKGSETGFLGKEKVMIDPRDVVDSKMLYSKKKKK